MILDCTTDRYDDLYAPWLVGAERLLQLAEFDPKTDWLLDLCSGTGIVTRTALDMGADPERVVLVDANPRCPDKRVVQIRSRVERLVSSPVDKVYDVVVCRQAMGYLDPGSTIRWVYRVLRPGGRFVFNTFGHPSPVGAKTYQFNGHRYAEAHLAHGDQVWHIQARLGIGGGVDVSRFTFHRPNWLYMLLTTEGFDVTVHGENNSYRWLCHKR